MGSRIVPDKEDGFAVEIVVKEINNKVKKLIPPVVDGVSVKAEEK
jgi:hypothetical protein